MSAAKSLCTGTSLAVALYLISQMPVLAGGTDNCGIDPPIPSVPRNAKAIQSSGADDTAAIQHALDQLKSGDWLVFSGTYNINRRLDIRASGVTLYGQGATILSHNPTDGALMIEGDSVAVYGFTIQQDSTSRQTTPWSGGISVYNNSRPVHNATIQNNTVKNSAAVGIFLFRADNFTVAKNTIWRSWADGIHMTAGSSNGRVIHNSVSENGDDMIGMVSSAGTRTPGPATSRFANWDGILATQLVHNIYVYDNQLSDQYWGRGVSVVGGSDVTIEGNTISRTPLAAAIYLTRETYWMTLGDHNILVKNNNISQVQTMAPSYQPPNINIVPTHMAAIELGTTQYEDEMSNSTYRDALSLSNIAIIGNSVASAKYAGLRMGQGSHGTVQIPDAAGSATLAQTPGLVANVTVRSNTFTDVGGTDLVEVHSGLDPGSIYCGDNNFNGTKWSTRCSAAMPGSNNVPVATGASLQCQANGVLIPVPVPSAPTSLTGGR